MQYLTKRESRLSSPNEFRGVCNHVTSFVFVIAAGLTRDESTAGDVSAGAGLATGLLGCVSSLLFRQRSSASSDWRRSTVRRNTSQYSTLMYIIHVVCTSDSPLAHSLDMRPPATHIHLHCTFPFYSVYIGFCFVLLHADCMW